MNVRYRQLRGLLIHYGRRSPKVIESEASWGYSRRSLIASSTVCPRTIGQKFTGLCRWCELPVPPQKRTWCGVGCVRAYGMAQGLQRSADGSYLLSTPLDTSCAECGLAGAWTNDGGRWPSFNLEIDHIVALSVAFYRGERDRLRAYTLDNLQWLCHNCHAVKTADDRRRLANLEAGRPEQWRDPVKVNKESQLAFNLGPRGEGIL